MTPTVGVLALQGAFAAHARILKTLGVDAVEVRTVAELDAVAALVIPGGESTTMSMLLERFGMLDAVRDRVFAGLPTFGTCAGMILLASEVLDGRPDQHCLAILPISVRRNGYGRQLASFESDLRIEGLDEPFHAIFIRAPVVESADESVEVLASVDGKPVLCRKGAVTVTAFHPELAKDSRVHRCWLVDSGLLDSNSCFDLEELA